MKQCLVVLGMHRSGTSALAGALQHIGVYLGRHLMPLEAGNNPKGFFENSLISEIDENILAACHSSWDDQFPLPEHWWQQDALIERHKRACDILQTEFQDHPLFGIKDPRLCLLLPFWQPIF